MRYLLDTNTVIDMLKACGDVQRQVIEHGPGNCYISDITVAELKVGCYISGNPKEHEALNYVVENFKTLRVSPQVLDRFARNRAVLRKIGKTIPVLDLIIISTAQVNDMTAVSHDEHFRYLPDLRIESWY